jgi:hypothetical protein
VAAEKGQAGLHRKLGEATNVVGRIEVRGPWEAMRNVVANVVGHNLRPIDGGFEDGRLFFRISQFEQVVNGGHADQAVSEAKGENEAARAKVVEGANSILDASKGLPEVSIRAVFDRSHARVPVPPLSTLNREGEVPHRLPKDLLGEGYLGGIETFEHRFIHSGDPFEDDIERFAARPGEPKSFQATIVGIGDLFEKTSLDGGFDGFAERGRGHAEAASDIGLGRLAAGGADGGEEIERSEGDVRDLKLGLERGREKLGQEPGLGGQGIAQRVHVALSMAYRGFTS